MLAKIFGGLLVASALAAAGFVSHSDPATGAAEPTCKEGTCCAQDCCKDCPNCSCECACCDDCTKGCECPNMQK